MENSLLETVEIEIRSVSNLSASFQEELHTWFKKQFPKSTFEWAEPQWYAFARVSNELVGRLGIVDRLITVGSLDVHVGGVGGIIVKETWRGRGIATRLLDAAHSFICNELKAPFALLICREELTPVYCKSRWSPVAASTFFTQSSGLQVSPRVTMIRVLAEQPWPAGLINLRGLPW